MDLRAYLDILRRRGWIILLVAVLAAAAALGISKVQTQIWQATVKVSTVPARPDWGLSNSAKDLLRNFVNNIQTHDMAQQVISQAKLDMSSYDLLAKLTVSAEPDNFLIRIDARDQDPSVARDIVLTLARAFVLERQAYYDTQDKANRIEVKLVDSVVDPVIYQPKPLTNTLAGGVLGALIGALIVLALEWMASDILAAPDIVERALGLPVLGTSPALERSSDSAGGPGAGSAAGATAGAAAGAGGRRSTDMKANLITLSDPSSAAAEAFRRLRANLTFAGLHDPLQTLLVAAASATPGTRSAAAADEDSVAANLAVAFAKVGKRVVLVDCDLRHPAQHMLFGLANTTGVTTALQDIGGALPLQSSEVSSLQVLTSGPAVDVPSDLIASPGMAELIRRLRAEADLVIFDAPPVLMATDAAELASQVDGVLLIVSAGRTRREEAQRAKDLLAKVGARVVGAVLANVQTDAALRKYLAA